MTSKKTTGQRVREARLAAGFTQVKLVAQIEGLSTAELSRAERGEKEFSPAHLKAIAKVLGVTQKSLLEEEPPQKTEGPQETLSSGEKKLLAAYRNAPAELKEAAMQILTGEAMLPTMLPDYPDYDDVDDFLDDFLDSEVNSVLGMEV